MNATRTMSDAWFKSSHTFRTRQNSALPPRAYPPAHRGWRNHLIHSRPVVSCRTHSALFRPLAVNIGLRYANSRSSFISFISIVAIAGLVLSVAVLVLVTSVMNGFERELRERVLGVVPHLTVRAR